MRIPLPRVLACQRGQCRPKREQPTDAEWLKSAAIIARYIPGIGDPLALDITEMDEWLVAINAVLALESGTHKGESSHRARVEAEMRRIHG